VLCSAGGVGEARVLGALPPLPVDFPFWPTVDDVVAQCRRRYGLSVVVLRMLTVPGTVNGMDGPVSYLAQLAEPVADGPTHGDGGTTDDGGVTGPTAGLLQPWAPGAGSPDPLSPQPNRARYAEPGGPQADLHWADAALAGLGRARTGEPTQLRTWNLSSIWSVPTAAGPVWLKAMPAFLVVEAPLLVWLADLDAANRSPGDQPPVASVLVAEPGRQLLADVPGQDHYGAGSEVTGEAVELLVQLQVAAAARVDELARFGVLDRRAEAATAAIVAVHERYRDVLGDDDNRAMDDLVASLPARFAAAAASGLPDTLVHGDFHPGNVRGMPGRLRLLDWGDAVVAHPVLDLIRLLGASPDEDAGRLTRLWARAWQRHLPGSDPTAALRPLQPVAELLGAVTYRRFLDHIEPDEHPYHLDDPLTCLRAAVSAAQPSPD